MRYYKIESLKNKFKDFNEFSDSVKIQKFFSENNLFEKLSINNFYTLPNVKSAYINEDDANRICLLAMFKFKGGDFNLNNIDSIDDSIELKKQFASDLKDFKSKMIEHYMNPIYVKLVKEQKDILNSQKIHKKDFSKNLGSYNIDISERKIVSIDFEYSSKYLENKNNIKSCSECGISVYENNKISSYHFIIEDGHKKNGLSKHLVDKFEFGDSITLKSEELLFILKEHLKEADYLISHGIENEYKILEDNGIDLSINNTELLDTLRMFISLDVNEGLNSYRLKDLVRACDMNEDNLHNAGNDAAYTVKTFLEMNNDSDKIRRNIEKLTIHYDETRPKRKTFKLK